MSHPISVVNSVHHTSTHASILNAIPRWLFTLVTSLAFTGCDKDKDAPGRVSSRAGISSTSVLQPDAQRAGHAQAVEGPSVEAPAPAAAGSVDLPVRLLSGLALAGVNTTLEIRSEEDFQRFRQEGRIQWISLSVAASQGDQPTGSPVDFEKERIIVRSFHPESGCGYQFEAGTARQENGEVFVSYHRVSPYRGWDSVRIECPRPYECYATDSTGSRRRSLTLTCHAYYVPQLALILPQSDLPTALYSQADPLAPAMENSMLPLLP